MLNLFRVSGNSMVPTLAAGDFVVTRRTRSIKVGDVVVVDTDEVGRIIKRIASLNGDAVTLVGDNPRLGSSCCTYCHQRDRIIGVLLFKFRLPFS
jgi:phage repressor protein C with HTH and peptisase S24 domain